MTIEIQPVIFDNLVCDLFVPAKRSPAVREVARTHDSNGFSYSITVRDALTGAEYDLSDLSSATVRFSAGAGTDVTDTPTASGSKLLGTIAFASVTQAREGTWSVAAELTMSGGEVLFTDSRDFMYVDGDYATATEIKRVPRLRTIDMNADLTTLVARPIAFHSGDVPSFVGITTSRLLTQHIDGGAVTIHAGTIDSAAGTVTFQIKDAATSTEGIHVGVFTLEGTRVQVAQKQELFFAKGIA